MPYTEHTAPRGTLEDARGSHSANSAGHQGFRLDELPEEISALAIDHLSPKDLSQLRLASRKWNGIAARSLYKNLAVLPVADSETRFRSVLSNPRLAALVRNVKLYTFKLPDVRASDYYEDSDDFDSDDGEDVVSDDEEEGTETKHKKVTFAQTLLDLENLPNFNAIAIIFTRDFRGEEADLDIDGGFFVEQKEARRKKLVQIFEVLQQNATYPRSLTIKHLQNYPDESTAANASFQATLHKLEELHIEVTEEEQDAGPDYDIEAKELRTFYPHLRTKWLEPISNKLTSLSLYNVNNWGLLPGYLDMKGLDLPCIRSLALGNYTIGYDDQLDWILNQSSLQELVLHNCVIAYWIGIGEEYIDVWNVSTRDWQELPRDSDRQSFAFQYNGTWEAVFDKIREGLPHLQSFRFDYVGRYDEPDICDRDWVGIWLSPRRYIFFESGTLPSRWLEADEAGNLKEDWWSPAGDSKGNRHEETRCGDARALWELVTTTDRRSRLHH